jgi:hypothetical protein
MLTDPNCIFPRSSLSCRTDFQGGLCDNSWGEQSLPSGAQLWSAARRLTGCRFSSASLLAPISPRTPLGGRQASLTKVVLVEIHRPCNPSGVKTAGPESVILSQFLVGLQCHIRAERPKPGIPLAPGRDPSPSLADPDDRVEAFFRSPLKVSATMLGMHLTPLAGRNNMVGWLFLEIPHCRAQGE